MIFPVAILAGGLATRLRPITEKIPKALLIVAGRPFIFHQLELLKSQGVNQVVLCVGYLGEQIEATVGDGSAFGLSISYVYDGAKLLGTGGALRKALPLLGADFFVLYGDSYLQCPYAAIQATYQQSGLLALMMVLRNEDKWDKSNVLYNEGKIIAYNKKAPYPEMKHIDYGLGLLSRKAIDKYGSREICDLAEIYQNLSQEGQLAGFEVTKRFYEIGSQQGLAETEKYLTTRGA